MWALVLLIPPTHLLQYIYKPFPDVLFVLFCYMLHSLVPGPLLGQLPSSLPKWSQRVMGEGPVSWFFMHKQTPVLAPNAAPSFCSIGVAAALQVD